MCASADVKQVQKNCKDKRCSLWHITDKMCSDTSPTICHWLIASRYIAGYVDMFACSASPLHKDTAWKERKEIPTVLLKLVKTSAANNMNMETCREDDSSCPYLQDRNIDMIQLLDARLHCMVNVTATKVFEGLQIQQSTNFQYA